MGMMLRLLKSILGPITYPVALIPLHSDKFERANGNLSPNTPWVHHPITTQYNQIVDGKVVGPTTFYSLDLVDIRIPNNQGYIKGRVSTPMSVLETGGNTRLNFKSGRGSTPAAANSFLSLALYAIDKMIVTSGYVFQQTWNTNLVTWVNEYRGESNQYREGDEFAVLWQGRKVWVYWNGEFEMYTLSDASWTPGYFAGIGLDIGHSLDEVEIGYFGPLTIRSYGDGFKSSNLELLWNLSQTKALVVDEAIQSDPAIATATGTFYSWGHSRQQMHEDDQLIRGFIKEPSGVTMGTNIASYLLGRCGSDPLDTTPKIAFLITPTNGAGIATLVGSTATNRNVVTSTVVGTLTYPVEIELQCIGNRYFGLINGQPVCEWQDTTNIVPIGEGRRGFGWMTSVIRNSSTYTHSHALDSVFANGNTNTPIGSPVINGVYPTTSPLVGGGTIVVSGTNIHAGSQILVGGTLCTSLERWSSNTIYGILPQKALGTYDVTLTSPNGDATIINGLEYVAQVPQGAYTGASTTLSTNSLYVRIPVSPNDSVTQIPTPTGVIQGLRKGYWRLRTQFSVSYYRSDIQEKFILPAGEVVGPTFPNLSGSVDVNFEFSTLADASLEIQFMKNASGSKVIAPTFELTLLSTTKFPSAITKLSTQLLAAINTFYKITSMNSLVEFSPSTNRVNDEIIVPETGQYIIEWAVNFSGNNAAHQARVTNQLGTVLATKTTSNTPGTATVTLTQGHSLKLEGYCTSTTTARRTVVEAGTYLKITPVL